MIRSRANSLRYSSAPPAPKASRSSDGRARISSAAPASTAGFEPGTAATPAAAQTSPDRIPSFVTRQTGGESAELRAEAGGLQGVRPVPRQMVEKHVPSQVHAPPPLLGEVSQDCEVVGHRSPSPPPREMIEPAERGVF